MLLRLGHETDGPLALLPGFPHGNYPRYLISFPLHLLKGCLKPAPRRQSRLVLLSLPWRETGRSRFPTSTQLVGLESPILLLNISQFTIQK
ncbi:hypothetical protein N7471_005025 [Penicillium samsonianum]|uniref:uncharacterized protein n=1 Tax=Penicillium samsonianum TaxID=1882272 RepID=UPI0025485C29|nr:uncharacterized protein N7471_005025 [Penicillium samsonianum]KAJ6138539.1 hypothetical protein N7471_005025 [Penicillium samsonianum]